MLAPSVYEYAILKLVPSVERGEALNAGIVLLCRACRFLAARCWLDWERLAVLAPECDLETAEEQLRIIERICAGEGPLAELDLIERFRWITAPRSTVLRASAVHTGLSDDPAHTLEQLFQILVAPPVDSPTES